MVILTKHVKVRMKERGIRVSSVKMVILEPEHKEQIFENKILVAGKIDGKVLEIIYSQKGNNFIIITAYWL